MRWRYAMSEALSLTGPALPAPGALAAPAPAGGRPARRRPFAQLNLVLEVVVGGAVELWAHKLRSLLTLNLLALGVFALVVMTSVLDGIMDKVGTGFAGLSWDGTVVLGPKEPKSGEDQKRFAMSPGLRYEDLPRLTAPSAKIRGFIPRAYENLPVRIAGG